MDRGSGLRGLGSGCTAEGLGSRGYGLAYGLDEEMQRNMSPKSCFRKPSVPNN